MKYPNGDARRFSYDDSDIYDERFPKRAIYF